MTMQYSDQIEIEADQATVWEIVSDPKVLAECIPGAEEVTRKTDTEYEGVISRSFAGLSVTVDGTVNLTDLAPPDRVVLTGGGTDRLTGMELEVDGEVTLDERGDSLTAVAYDFELEFIGRLPVHYFKKRIDTDIAQFIENVTKAVEES